ncbi:putative T7SS-secreted protein [Streptomyces cadmiisoli]|uniref:putative T7SS-secreted protein n=1 Tax=Streptomyces cadmiisoli TaxID=2184053 RepID=UPI00364BEFC2
MSLTPGVEPSPYADSQARRNGPLPQGLKSSPHIPNPGYPHLGFNPVPGDTETVRTLHKKLSGCAKVLSDTHGLVTKLLDGSYWKGDAAVAFREQLDDGPLPTNLKNAAHSLRKAAKQLNHWEGELDEFQRRAKKLEEEARDAQDAVDRAAGRASKPDGADVAEAVEEAEAELERIRGRARRLAEEHEGRARHRAAKIRDATEKLAPQEPGWFDEALDWLGENLPDILSFVAGVIAVVAIVFAGPLGVAMVAGLMLVASAVSATALALRLSDGETWASLMDGFSKGEFDADFWSNAVSVGADFVGSLPGVGAVAKGGITGLRAVGGSTEVLSLGQKLALYGAKTMDEAKAISGLENTLVAHAVRGARNPQATARAVGMTSGLVGVGTAGFGLYNKVVDADDSKYKDGTVAGIDGARLIVDSGAIVRLVQFLR